LVFKGGTCLTKVHAGFYRLSEDLDFAVPMPADAPRSRRARVMGPVKAAVKTAIGDSDCFRLSQPLKGANNCSHYVGAAAYRSLLTGQEETIKLEFSLREPLLQPARAGEAATILLNPVSANPMIAPVAVRCISAEESLAEKYRAALSRREVAIRDFYDLQHVVAKLRIPVGQPGFVDLVRRKLAVSGGDVISVDPARLGRLRQQLDGRLKPVLRPVDFDGFDLDAAIDLVGAMAKVLGGGR